MLERANKQGTKKVSFGADSQTINILISLVREKCKHNKQVVMYEAGVGTGHSIAEVISHCTTAGGKVELSTDLSIKGCDVFLLPTAQALIGQFPNVDIDIEEGHVFDCIRKLPDNSIDIFYADNVFEHFIPDESERIYSEIARKLKPDAYVFLVIPNRFVGPQDISMYFLPFGSKAKGFHYMEMSFNDVANEMKKYSIFHSHCVFFIPKVGGFAIKNKVLLKIKLALESTLAKIPNAFLRKLMFSVGGYSFSIMKFVDSHATDREREAPPK